MSASFGTIELPDGQGGTKTYLEKFYIYTIIFTLDSTAGSLGGFLQPRVVLQGDGGFLLKYLAVNYQITASAPDYFRMRLGNSDGSQWYSSAGVVAGGGGNDRVHSTSILGNGQFPFPVLPYILYLPNGSINLDVQNLVARTNVVEMAFIGSKLFDPGNG